MSDEKQQLMQAYRKEKNGDVIKRLQLMLYVKIDGMTPSKAANTMHMSRSWGGKWNKRYEEGGIDGLRDKPRSGILDRGLSRHDEEGEKDGTQDPCVDC